MTATEFRGCLLLALTTSWVPALVLDLWWLHIFGWLIVVIAVASRAKAVKAAAKRKEL